MVATLNRSTVPKAVPRRMDKDLHNLLNAIASDNDYEIQKIRDEIVRKLVMMMATADIAGRWRFIQDLKPKKKRFQTVEDKTVQVMWGKPLTEAVDDFARREPLLRDTGVEVAELYLGRSDAFSVAGVSTDETLNQIKGMLQMALARGMPQTDFKDAAEYVLENFTRPRLETIFRTNIATAYAAGRLDQSRKTENVAGFRRISAKIVTTRPSHEAAHGHIYSKEDLRIAWFMLPWGYNCMCNDVPITIRAAKAQGMDFDRDRMITPTWPANANPDKGFTAAGGVSGLYGIG
jgi:SPP1 gp7 family putative phage head morphogenesis protein